MIRHVQKTKGFTLLEAVIVLSLVIIVSSLIFASFGALQDRQILDSEVAQVKSYIQKARMNSLNSKKGDAHGIFFGTSTIRTVEVSTSSLLYVYTLHNRVRLVQSTLGTSTLVFARVSGLPNATGTLTYVYSVGGKGKGTSTITINGLGITQ